jgi:alpha-L-rhamnosidase
MQAWVSFMRAQAGDDLIWDTGFHFGDWLAVEALDPQYPLAVTDKSLICTAFFAYSTGLLAQAAERLGRADEAAEYRALRERICAAFVHEFLTPAGRLAGNTQTGYVLALQFDLLPPDLRAEAIRRLAADIRARDTHLTTGFIGTSYLCHVLSDNGELELAYALLEQKSYPSWLYPVTLGATTSWERWDNIRPDGSLQTPNANSFNHYAFGAIGDWLYRVVAGINPDPAAPGYKRILFRPRPGGSLSGAEAVFDSLYGKIHSGWTRVPGGMEYRFTVPPNTRASVVLPAPSIDSVTEGGEPLAAAEGVSDISHADANVVFQVGAGRYVLYVQGE